MRLLRFSRSLPSPAPLAPGVSIFGIGAQKAGTTWLHTRLVKHPGAFYPHDKEIHYWDAFKERGLDWYRSLFSAAKEGQKRGEITPAYAVLEPEVIAEIKQAFPDLRVFYILRNPVERAWSAALMNLYRAEMTFSEASDRWFLDHFHAASSLKRGDYVRCLYNWRAVFGDDRILVMLFDDICRDPRGLLERLARHIGIDPQPFRDESEDTMRRVELAGSGDKIRPALRRCLVELYAPKIEALEQATGLDLSAWRAANAREDEGVSATLFTRLSRFFSASRLTSGRAGVKPVVVMLGMHNAGTSLLAQIAAKLGVHLGEDLLMRSRYDNPPAYDYWEHAGIVDIQDRLLKTLGHHPGERGGYLPIDPQLWSQPPIRPYREALREILVREVAAAKTAPFGFKDPRTARLMPLWHGIFTELNLAPKFLIATRACAQVSRSFARKNAQPLPRAESLWRRTYLEALIASRGFERYILRYEDWALAAERIVASLDDFLGLRGDRAAALAAIDLGISDFRAASSQPLSALSAGVEALLALAAGGVDTLADEQALWAACDHRDARQLE